MTLILELPDDKADELREAFGPQLDRAALEALIIEGYRTRKFGEGVVRRLLGLESRWDAQEWLSKRGIPSNYSIEDIQADRRTLDNVLGQTE
jgi:hypothetical protein